MTEAEKKQLVEDLVALGLPRAETKAAVDAGGQGIYEDGELVGVWTPTSNDSQKALQEA